MESYLLNNSPNWMTDEAGLKYPQGQISIYYKYGIDGSKLVVLYYVDEFLYWYTYEELEK